MTDERFEDEPKQEGRGRTAAKRAAKAIEETAQQLVDLPETALAGLPLDAELLRELKLARATRGHSSRKRQIKHFAGLLRRSELVPEIDLFLHGQQQSHFEATQAFHDLEQLRDRLCTAADSDAALNEVRRALPALDQNKLTRLVRNVLATSDKKAYREIFRLLRSASEQQP